MNRRGFLKTMLAALSALIWPSKRTEVRQGNSLVVRKWQQDSRGVWLGENDAVFDIEYLYAANVHVLPVTVQLEDGRIVTITDCGVFWLNSATMQIEDIIEELTGQCQNTDSLPDSKTASACAALR